MRSESLHEVFSNFIEMEQKVASGAQEADHKNTWRYVQAFLLRYASLISGNMRI